MDSQDMKIRAVGPAYGPPQAGGLPVWGALFGLVLAAVGCLIRPAAGRAQPTAVAAADSHACAGKDLEADFRAAADLYGLAVGAPDADPSRRAERLAKAEHCLLRQALLMLMPARAHTLLGKVLLASGRAVQALDRFSVAKGRVKELEQEQARRGELFVGQRELEAAREAARLFADVERQVRVTLVVDRGQWQGLTLRLDDGPAEPVRKARPGAGAQQELELQVQPGPHQLKAANGCGGSWVGELNNSQDTGLRIELLFDKPCPSPVWLQLPGAAPPGLALELAGKPFTGRAVQRPNQSHGQPQLLALEVGPGQALLVVSNGCGGTWQRTIDAVADRDKQLPVIFDKPCAVESTGLTTSELVGLVAMGVGGTAFLTGVVWYVLEQPVRERLDERCAGGNCDVQGARDFNDRALVQEALLAAGAVTALGGLLTYLFGPAVLGENAAQTGTAGVSLRLGPGQAQLQGRF